jgi:hypothetical protein
LLEALDDEHRAWASYDQVIEDFGPVRPFTNIRASEERHIAALRQLFEHYGLAIPENPWPGRVERYGSLEEACKAGVEAEIANGSMYDRLIRGTQKPDIVRVLSNLQDASQQRHLPAFQRCAGRGYGRGQRGDGRCGRARRGACHGG